MSNSPSIATTTLPSVDDEHATATVASVVTVATVLIVVFSVLAIIRMRKQSKATSQSSVRFNDVAPAKNDESMMHTLPLPMSGPMASPLNRTAQNETYM